MSDSFKFPTDTCVLVCSGPSLNLVDPFSLGFPVVCVSTAIRSIPNPHFWILADFLNEMHGSEGNAAYQNENIVKILPAGKVNPRQNATVRNYQEIKYSDSDRTIRDTTTHLFSGELPMLKGPHKSATFAIQWLHYAGVKNVIWVGNDLNAPSAKGKYSYESNASDLRKAHNFNTTLDQVHQSLKLWYPKAKTLGYTWSSWKCGDVFESLVPAFNAEEHIVPVDSQFLTPAAKSNHVEIEYQTQKVVPTRIRKEERHKLREFRKKNVDSVIDKKKINKERIEKQSESKRAELSARMARNATRIITTPKTPISGKKSPRYVNISKSNLNMNSINKAIRDALR